MLLVLNILTKTAGIQHTFHDMFIDTVARYTLHSLWRGSLSPHPVNPFDILSRFRLGRDFTDAHHTIAATMSSFQPTDLLTPSPEELLTLTPEEIELLNNVVLEAYAPRKRVEGLSKQGVGLFIEPCTVCQEGFGDDLGQSPSPQLNACTHLFHTDCHDELINGAYRTDVMCPVCRAKICDSRPTRAKVDTT
jgi:hypothetical protein